MWHLFPFYDKPINNESEPIMSGIRVKFEVRIDFNCGNNNGIALLSHN